MTATKHTDAPRVGLFVTCLVDLFRPRIGFATVRLLERTGCQVIVPERQTCCGQPAYNSGDLADTRAFARQTIDAFEGCDYIVAPSGSCTGQLRKYPELFDDEPDWRAKAEDFANRSHEILAFLVDIMGMEAVDAEFNHSATYHDGCSGLRELGVRDQPRRLLGSVRGLTLHEMRETEVCCGFGGTFCVKYPEISERMVTNKVENITATDSDSVLAGELGCLMNIAGRLRRLGHEVSAFHTVEVLAGMADDPGLGDTRR